MHIFNVKLLGDRILGRAMLSVRAAHRVESDRAIATAYIQSPGAY